jgi:hypothetical protein
MYNSVLYFNMSLPKLPFESSSSFGRLLVSSWKNPKSVIDNKWSEEEANILALTSYSILHDRRIPQCQVKEIETHYAVRYINPPSPISLPVSPFLVLSTFPSKSPDATQNVLVQDSTVFNQDLACVINLSPKLILAMQSLKQADPYSKTMDTKFADLRPGARTPAGWEWLLGSQIEPLSSTEVKKGKVFAPFLNTLNEILGQSPRIWIAAYQDLKSVRSACGYNDERDATSWVIPLGMRHAIGSVYLVFKFTAAEVGLNALYRPNHLDAGFYKEHFPSPVSHTVGYTMHLNDDSHHHLVREYIHSPIKFKPEHLHSVAITRSESGQDKIPQWRKKHYQRLQRVHEEHEKSNRHFDRLEVELFPEHGGQESCSNGGTCSCTHDACCKIWP